MTTTTEEWSASTLTRDAAHLNRVRKALAEKSREVDRAKGPSQRSAARNQGAALAKDLHPRSAARNRGAGPAKGLPPKRAARNQGAAPAKGLPRRSAESVPTFFGADHIRK